MCTQKNTKSLILLFFIIDVIKPFRCFIAGQFLVAAIWAIDMSLRPSLIKVMINKVSMVTPSEAFDVLLPQAIFYIFMSIIIVVVFRFYEWLILHFHPNLKKHIGVILMERIMNHSQNFYQNNFSGSVANKINDVINGIPNILDILVDRFFSYVLGLSIAIYTVWLIDLRFAIGLTLWIMIFLAVSIKLSEKAKLLVREAAEVNSTVMGNIVDILGNIGSVRLFSAKRLETDYLNEAYQHLVKAVQVRDGFFYENAHISKKFLHCFPIYLLLVVDYRCSKPNYYFW